MRVLFYLGHPAHYHMLREPAMELRRKGHEVAFAVKAKDILGELLAREEIEQIPMARVGRAKGTIPMAMHLIRREFVLWRLLRKRKFDLMVGTEPSIAHIGRLFGIPSIMMLEDDLSVIPLFAKVSFPFTNQILAPDSCELGKWTKKKIGYPGYQKLSYLHPRIFEPDPAKVAHLRKDGRPYFLLRFSALDAHHDVGIEGLSDQLVRTVIERLEARGNVYISSERPVDSDLERYRLKLPVENIHHALYFAEIFLSDSQSMTVEAALLGTPSIRFSDFVGRIGVLEELEHRYQLTFGFRTNNAEGFLVKVDELLVESNLRGDFRKRREVMLTEKIDVCEFWVWLFENYPDSVDVLHKDGRYIERFS